jgi:hypothetical protein
MGLGFWSNRNTKYDIKNCEGKGTKTGDKPSYAIQPKKDDRDSSPTKLAAGFGRGIVHSTQRFSAVHTPTQFITTFVATDWTWRLGLLLR